MASLFMNLFIVTGQVGTLFLLMSIGFVLAKLGKLTQEALPQLSFLLLYVVTPCIIIDSLQVDFDPALFHDLAASFFLVLLSFAVCAVVCLAFFRKENKDTRDTMRFAVIFGNTGFMGFPLMSAILGEDSLIYSMPVFVAFNLGVWTYGVYLMGGKENFSIKKVLLSPPILGILVALPMFFLGIRLPSAIGSTIGFVADLNTPLAMIVIGAQMAAADIPATFRNTRLYTTAVLKLIFLPALTVVMLLPLGLNPISFVAVVILAGVPTAGVTAMFAEQFNRDKEGSAQVVTLSTLISIVTLPVVAVIAEQLGGLA